MELSFKELDHINLNSRLHANFACDYSEDGRIFILTEHGVYLLTLKGSLENTLPKYSFRKDIIEISQTCLSEHLDIELSSCIQELSRDYLYEAVLDVGLSGNNINAAKIQAKPVYAVWSPKGVIEKTECALAVLTNLNNIEVYVRCVDENEIISYECVANFSKDVCDNWKKSWKRVDGCSADAQMEELKKRIEFSTPTTFAWSQIVLKDRRAGCILFVGHRDGAISAWRFRSRKVNEPHESRLEFLGRHDSKVKHITALHWFCQRSDAGGLTVGDSEGRVSALSVSKLSTDKIKFADEVIISNECDLKADKITIVTHKNITYIIVVKLNYLLIFTITEFGEVLQGKLIQVGNLYITGVLHYERNFILVLSVCGQLKQIELNVVDNDLQFNEKTITLDMDINKYRTHGFLFSPNKVFLGVLAYPCHLKDVSKGKGFVNFFILRNNTLDPFNLLINIQATSLRDHWDCLESLRVMCIREKRFPWVGIDTNLNYDSQPLLKLKILRLIAKMSETIYSVIPRIEEYNIKAYSLLNYAVDIKMAVQRMTKLLNIYFSEKKLTLFQMQSLDLLNFFLKEIVAMEILTKANLGTVFVDEIYEVMRIANELTYPPPPQCIWCGEKIMGASCVPYHIDSRCAISLMPIKTIPGFKCSFCGCVVCKDMEKEYQPIFCPYCDIPMDRRCQDRKKCDFVDASKPVTVDAVITQLGEVVISDCHEDCSNERFNPADLEENTVEYIQLTDSDDEDCRWGSNEMYAKIRNIVLDSEVRNEDDDIINESILEEVDKNYSNNQEDEELGWGL